MIRFTVASYVIDQNTATANIHGRESGSRSGPAWMQLAVSFAKFQCLSAFEVPLEIVTVAVGADGHIVLEVLRTTRYRHAPIHQHQKADSKRAFEEAKDSRLFSHKSNFFFF